MRMSAPLILNGERRGCTQTYDATIGDANVATLDIDSATDNLIDINK